jgi:beta-N-acetylhexosaminidase
MVCHTMSAQVGAMEHVIQAVKSGEISQEAIQTSVTRVHELNRKYLSPLSAALPTSVDMGMANKRHAALASRMYARSTTVVRSVPGHLPILKGPETKLVYLLPGKSPLGGGLGGGAVDSGEEKTREPYLKNSFMDLLEPDNPLVHAIQYFDSKPLDQGEEVLIDQADVVVFCTRNASLSQYQKDLGLSLGKKLGNKLIVVATCDPYDFLDDVEAIQNYITTYEPTLEAFRSALDVIFGAIPASGVLPVGSGQVKHDIRNLDSTSEDDVTHVWNLWQEIFPTWPIERSRLALILTLGSPIHLIHDKGFSLAYYDQAETGLHGMLSVVGVLESYRSKGLGTALVNKTREELLARSGTGTLASFGIKSSFPRIWPGVPLSLPAKEREFFLHRGEIILLSFTRTIHIGRSCLGCHWRILDVSNHFIGFHRSQLPTSRDLFKSIATEIAPPAVLERVAKLPLTFSPWSEKLYKECMTKQRANFNNNKVRACTNEFARYP